MPDVERAASCPEQRRGRKRKPGLLEVEPLEHVERREPDEQRDRDLPGAPAPAAEVEGADDQRDAGRNRERVEERDELDRLDPQEQVAAPGDVGRQRGREVDGADRERDCGGQRREPFEPPPLAQRRGDAMDPEPPDAVSRSPGKRSRQSLITSQAPAAKSTSAARSFPSAPIVAATPASAKPRWKSWIRRPRTYTRGPLGWRSSRTIKITVAWLSDR